MSSYALGCDYAWKPHPTIGALRTAGITFVCRYLSRDPSKNLTGAELAALVGNGIHVVLNWEDGAQNMAGGHAQGILDAQDAADQRAALGMDDAPVYFSADFDAQAIGAVNACVDYMGAVNSVIGGSELSGDYGDFVVAQACLSAGVSHYTWGTPAWAGDPHGWNVNIYQYDNTATLGGVNVDLDAGYGVDYGQWPRPTPGPPPVVYPVHVGLPLPVLDLGKVSNFVQFMQAGLNISGGTMNTVTDGDYGPLTKARVVDFQVHHALATDGVCGPLTWSALVGSLQVPTLSEGDLSNYVQLAQASLNISAGTMATACDGNFGPATKSRVQQFQVNHALSPDGIVGQATWARLVA